VMSHGAHECRRLMISLQLTDVGADLHGPQVPALWSVVLQQRLKSRLLGQWLDTLHQALGNVGEVARLAEVEIVTQSVADRGILRHLQAIFVGLKTRQFLTNLLVVGLLGSTERRQSFPPQIPPPVAPLVPLGIEELTKPARRRTQVGLRLLNF